MIDYINFKELEAHWDEVGAWYYTLNNVPYTGCAVEFFVNGQKAAESNFLNGYQEGIQRFWYENGQLKSEDNMNNNIYNGLSKSWYENGILKYESKNEMGKTIWYKRYNEEGKLIK